MHLLGIEKYEENSLEQKKFSMMNAYERLTDHNFAEDVSKQDLRKRTVKLAQFREGFKSLMHDDRPFAYAMALQAISTKGQTELQQKLRALGLEAVNNMTGKQHEIVTTKNGYTLN